MPARWQPTTKPDGIDGINWNREQALDVSFEIRRKPSMGRSLVVADGIVNNAAADKSNASTWNDDNAANVETTGEILTNEETKLPKERRRPT